MPLQRPTLEELRQSFAADVESRLPGADSQLRRSFLGVLSIALAGAVHLLYGFLEFVSRQVFPDSAEAEFLNRWSGVWGIDRKPADPAVGDITFTGTNGSVVPLGAVLQRGDGAEYVTSAIATIAAGTATVGVEASVPGVDGNADAGATLNLTSPIAGVQSAAVVAAGGLVDGTEEESDASLLARLLDRIQLPPHGGASFDYTKWALEVPDVTRAWVYPQELGLGTVTVRFMMDDKYADGIPLAADVAAVQAYIDARRPVTADVTVVAPVAVALDFTIAGLDPVSATVQAAIEAELKDLIRREGEPDVTMLISHMREAISIAAGEHDHQLTVPAANVNYGVGQIPVFGAITWA